VNPEQSSAARRLPGQGQGPELLISRKAQGARRRAAQINRGHPPRSRLLISRKSVARRKAPGASAASSIKHEQGARRKVSAAPKCWKL